MDSPTTNRAALKILGEQHPTWICITCIVHALNLLCKDLANNSRRSEKHTEVGRVLKENGTGLRGGGPLQMRTATPSALRRLRNWCSFKLMMSSPTATS
ncbi:hypothetical protein HaLaN_17973, partial [Haematococcus lacustris]